MNWAKYALAGLILGCSRQAPTPPPDRFQTVRSFACQLQNVNLDQVPRVDLFITDPTRDGNSAYSPEEVAGLKRGGRLLLAYLSVGEAENYRPYWQKDWKPGLPAWLGPTNPDWGGNYKVRYWDPAWRKIVADGARQIAAQGFDGLFLDVVDGWEFWLKANPQARQAMIDLVLDLRRQHPTLGLVLNGGDGLLDAPELVEAITGVAKEEMFFGLNGDGKITPPQFTRDCQMRLQRLVDAKKLILSIDYTKDPRQKRLAYERAQRSGYLEFIGTRGLDAIPAQQ